MCTDQIEIKLNIYDLHPHNKYYHWLGLGAYHAGVEFLGKGKIIINSINVSLKYTL